MIISKGIGIDLGTTNSAVATMNATDTDVHLYSDSLERSTVPSCVWCKSTGGPLATGYEAYTRCGGRPEPIRSIKRKMGTSLLTPMGTAAEIPQNVPPELGRRLAANQEARREQFQATLDGAARAGLGDRPPLLWLPEEVSACIVDDMRRRIAELLAGMAGSGETYAPEHGIITVPAYFGLSQIEATREAGRLAGMEVIDLLHEPTAAAVYYSWRHKISDGVFMVYDLGGGTFDVSILRRTHGEFEVLGISGDNFLGGDDLDRILAEWIRKRLAGEYRLDLHPDTDPEDAIRFRRLTVLAEDAKKALSSQETYLLRGQSSLRDQDDEPVMVEMQIQRSDFENEIRDVIRRTLPKCWESLARAYCRSGITMKDVNHILLAGGSTCIPLVQKVVREHFCGDAKHAPPGKQELDVVLAGVDDKDREIARKLMEKRELADCREPILDSPKTCVAMGAAIRAAAAGTYVYDDARRARLFFRGQAGTSEQTCDLTGFAQTGDGGKPLAGATIRLTGADGELLSQQAVDESGRFRFRSLDLTGEAVTRFGIAILDSGGKIVAEMGRNVARSAEHRDIGSVLSTAVLAKPIVLEIADQDRLVRGVLLEEGCSLPAVGQFRFFLRDQSGLIRFPLYQGNQPIRELTIRLDAKCEVGSPVDLTVHCDEQMYIRLGVDVGAHEFAVDVGPPPPPAPPTPAEILEIMNRFKSRLSVLDAEEQASFVQRCDGLLDDLRKAMAAADHAKAISKFADITGLLKSMDLRTPRLEPPWGQVERLYANVLEVVAFGELCLDSYDAEVGRATLEGYHHAARNALAAGDQQLYREAVVNMKAYGDALRKEFAEKLVGKQRRDLPDDQAAAIALADLRQRADALRMLAFGAGRRDLDGPLQTMARAAMEMEARIASDPREVIRWCQQQRNELNRYDQQVTNAGEGSAKIKDGMLSLSAALGPKDYALGKESGEIRKEP
jgi:molecular chaperone DnaK